MSTVEASNIIGTSKISTANQITLVKDVIEALNAKQGDLILFLEEGNRIYIAKGRVEQA